MKLTLTQLHRLPWKIVSHIAMEHEHASIYMAEINGIQISKCVHVAKNDNGFGRSYTHYMIGFVSKVYKSHKSVVDAINELLSTTKNIHKI